ncbi:diacylglycerol kinase family lipid kinase [candidate division KSB1 bacterium]|nr:diacylglycerol kinase family lipid kinase [candidate division KSB1 bacterium]
MKKRILFVVNPIAGGGKGVRRISRLIPMLIQNQQWHYEIRITTARGDAHEIAKAAVTAGYDTVVAVGGDGTVNEIASALIHTPTSLGIITAGSGNGVARGLSLPQMLPRAVQNLYTGVPRKIDVGSVGKRYFFATTGMGFDAVIGKLFDEGNIRGPLPYFYIGIREFFTYQPQEYCLKFNNQEHRFKALLVAVANTNQFGNGALIAPMAQVDDGLLDICIIHDINAFHAIKDLPKLFTGQLPRSEYYSFFRSQAVEIERPERGPLHVDGEPIDGDRTVQVRVIPQALSVIVPMRKKGRLPFLKSLATVTRNFLY